MNKELNDLADLLEHTIIRAGEGIKEKFLADMAAAAALADRFIPVLRMAAILHRYNIQFGKHLTGSFLQCFHDYAASYEFDDCGKYKLGVDRVDRNRGKCLLSIYAGYVNHDLVEFKAAPCGDVWIDHEWGWKYGIHHDGTPLIQGPKDGKNICLITEPWSIPEYRNAPALFLKYFPIFEKHFVKYVKTVIRQMEKGK